jgi:hypothetical protein
VKKLAIFERDAHIEALNLSVTFRYIAGKRTPDRPLGKANLVANRD